MSTTNHSMFEALFDRRLKPTGEFARRLAAAGYDPKRALAKYPTQVWITCLELARADRWPTLDPRDAYRQIGVEFTRGFLETLSGKLVAAAVPFMTPRTYLRRLASYIRLGRSDEAFAFDLVRDEEGAVDIVVHNPAAVPGGFVAGMIDVGFEKLKTKPDIAIEQKTPYDYRLEVRWKR